MIPITCILRLLHVDPQLTDSLFFFFFFFGLFPLLCLILDNFYCYDFRFPCHFLRNFESPVSPIQYVFHLTHDIFYLYISDLCFLYITCLYLTLSVFPESLFFLIYCSKSKVYHSDHFQVYSSVALSTFTV